MLLAAFLMHRRSMSVTWGVQLTMARLFLTWSKPNSSTSRMIDALTKEDGTLSAPEKDNVMC